MIHICFQTKDEAWGGANQFLKNLKKEFQRLDLYSDDPREASFILFNSHHHLETVQALKEDLPSETKFIHRVDGPMKLYNSADDERDDIVYRANNILADATVFQSNYSFEKSLDAGMKTDKPIAVIYNAADPDIFKADAKSLGSIRKQMASGKKPKIISTSFSMNLQKGFQFLKFLETNLDFNNLSYVFAGRSPFPFVKIKDLGCINSQELSSELRSSDIFVTASSNDPCSNSLIEAISCGLPCLALDSGGHPEIIHETNGGLTFGGIHDFDEKMDEIMSNYDSYFSKIKPFDIKQQAQKYVDFMKKIG